MKKKVRIVNEPGRIRRRKSGTGLVFRLYHPTQDAASPRPSGEERAEAGITDRRHVANRRNRNICTNTKGTIARTVVRKYPSAAESRPVRGSATALHKLAGHSTPNNELDP